MISEIIDTIINKSVIIAIFNENIKNKQLPINDTKHCGNHGHWLETQMGLKINNKLAPDILGFEMKKDSVKITFGDWGPCFKLFQDNTFFPELSKKNRRIKFFQMFGRPNLAKYNRLSYTRPKINQNIDGKYMIINDDHIDIIYNYSLDNRENKSDIIPMEYRRMLILERWNIKKISDKIRSKFNQNGWFQCLYNEQKCFTDIRFYKPFDVHKFIDLIKRGIIYQDGVPYMTNNRWYSQWRINKTYIHYLYEVA